MMLHNEYPIGSRFMAPAPDGPDLIEVEVVGHVAGPDLRGGGRHIGLMVRRAADEGDQRPYEIASDFLEPGEDAPAPNPHFAAMTAAEAAARWGLDGSTIRKAIAAGRLPARKSGGTWLVTRPAMEAAFGPEPRK